MSALFKNLVNKGGVAKLNHINGNRVASVGEKVKSFNPATGEVNAEFGSTTASEFQTAIEYAKTAQGHWAATTPMDRSDILRRAADLLDKYREDLAYVEVMDIGKPIIEAKLDVQTGIDALKYCGGVSMALLGGETQTGAGWRGTSHRVPMGIVGGIGAWNYPIQIASFKAAPALACGNAVIFKPSEYTPLSAVILGDILTEAGLPNGLFQVVQGVGPVGRMITESADINKITFTGSVPTGKAILAKSGEFVRPVTLELGGKSPLIIFDDFDVDQAVQGALQANFYSQGQVCSNGARVYVQEKIYDEFKEKIVQAVRDIKVGDPLKEETRMGALSSVEHREKISGFIQGAIAEGANVLFGGDVIEGPGYFMNPCVMECSDEMTITKEEHFGPILQLYKFKTEDEAVIRANATELGLAAGVFSNDYYTLQRVGDALEAGTIYHNCYNLAPAELGFGGFKQSGIGKENGTEFISQFTRLKCKFYMNDDSKILEF